ncbi:ATP-binding protein [Micromonospora auratinigra]|uniref:Helix-turn-helix domain-containing protein n=1 Tax=Micromonospora auratinigra TaxID=261654 RepID=A0A1A8ZHB0_9ACTN|nr:XRE family transcriptional regulator [Micromonospora auratinigra]SBT43226.1 Helix-turn-helix domain-containing protein [Micromonospora auratinigra]
MSSDTFGGLLRRHRLRARLTQEALAEAAEVSSRSVRDIERGGSRAPRPRTVERLATALGLVGDERDAFLRHGARLFWAARSGEPEPVEPPGSDRRAAAPARADRAAAAPAGVDRRADPPAGADPGADEPAGPWPVRQLPTDTADFVGREAELAEVREAVDGGCALVAVSGPPGVGKTAFALHAAHLLADRFPDGQLFVRVGDRSAADAGATELLARLLRTVGVSGQALPTGTDERAALLRHRLAGRRVLLVLDDVAGHADVEPVLPPAGSAVLVTSRLPLTGLPGVRALDLAPLTDEAGIALLSRVAGTDRVRGEALAARELIAVCGGLPLAVRIVAARLAARPHWTVGGLTRRLTDDRVRLDEFRYGDLAVRPHLQLAHEGLTPAAARAFALLGGLPVPSFPEWAVSALLDVDLARGAVVLDELLDARLVDAVGLDHADQPRFRLHEITRLYARECQERQVTAADSAAALSRVAEGWLALARHARQHLRCETFQLDDPGLPAALDAPAVAELAARRPIDWFEAERPVLTALVVACASAGLAATARCLVGCATDFYASRAYYEDWQRATLAALDACRDAGDRAGEAALTRSLGSCLIEVAAPEEAAAVLRTARGLALAVDDRAGAATARKDLGFILGLSGALDEAEGELRAAADELALVGNPGTAIALTNLAFVQQQRGNAAAALETSEAALLVARTGDSPITEAFALRRLSSTRLENGRVAEAQQAARRAVELFQWSGDAIGAAQSMRALGEALARDPARRAEAEQVFARAADLFRERGHRWGLALTELSLGELEATHDGPAAVERLRRALHYWTEESVPALRARTLVALAVASESDDPVAAAEFRAEAAQVRRQLGS